ncbi:MAG: hypothetical protein NTV24_02260 [Candidatus Woesebacteria bacterium]|nr:hypothetical protein [Candidatus Woesebacteria bacterium]
MKAKKTGIGLIPLIIFALFLSLIFLTSHLYPLYFYTAYISLKDSSDSNLNLRLNEDINVGNVFSDKKPSTDWKLIETNHFRLYAPKNWLVGSITDGSEEYIGLSKKLVDGKDWNFAINMGREKTLRDSLVAKVKDIELIQHEIPQYRDPTYRQFCRINFSNYHGFLLIDTIFFTHKGKVYEVYLDPSLGSTNEDFLKILSTLEIKINFP